MKKIVLASNNKHKIKEFNEILDNIEILTLSDIGYLDTINCHIKMFLLNYTDYYKGR